MSFDLYFGREDLTLPAMEDLRSYFQKRASFTVNEVENGGTQVWYKNDATGVYCWFDFESPNDEEEDLTRFRSGYSFSINYLRPSFFAYEGMPLVDSFCKHFSLLVEDSQEETVHAGHAAQLISSWRSQNERAVRGVAQSAPDDPGDKIDLCYLPEDRATEWWRYAGIKESLQDSVGENIFVPSLMIFETPEKELITVIVWPEAISQFFPRCDYVLLQRKKKGLFRTTEETGIIRYEDVMASVGPYLTDYSTSIGPLKYLPPERQENVVSLHRDVNLMAIDLSKHNNVASDRFHDVVLS